MSRTWVRDSKGIPYTWREGKLWKGNRPKPTSFEVVEGARQESVVPVQGGVIVIDKEGVVGFLGD